MGSAFVSQPTPDAGSAKQPGAMLTIGELSSTIGVPTHILRYWETKFPELKPLKRSGNRRYYRPEDVALAKRIHELLHARGYTVRGAQLALKDKSSGASERVVPAAETRPEAATAVPSTIDLTRLRAVRDRLATALAAA